MLVWHREIITSRSLRQTFSCLYLNIFKYFPSSVFCHHPLQEITQSTDLYNFFLYYSQPFVAQAIRAILVDLHMPFHSYRIGTLVRQVGKQWEPFKSFLQIVVIIVPDTLQVSRGTHKWNRSPFTRRTKAESIRRIV